MPQSTNKGTVVLPYSKDSLFLAEPSSYLYLNGGEVKPGCVQGYGGSEGRIEVEVGRIGEPNLPLAVPFKLALTLY